MNKNNLKFWTKIDWFLLSIILVTFGLSLYFWPRLPKIVPTHWNAQGQVDGWGPKWIDLFLLPAINVAILFFMILLPRIDPLAKNYQEFAKEYTGLRTLLVIFFAFLYGTILYTLLNPISNIFRFVFPIGFGIFFIYIGYILPRFKTNWFIGIKTPWTLSSKESWRKTHALGGKLFILAGIIAILGSAFFPNYNFAIFISAIILAGLVPVIYSYFFWKKE